MEAWHYTALNSQFNQLQQKLLSTMQTAKDDSINSGPMDEDRYNNNIHSLKSGVKRKAASDQQSPEVSQNKNVKRESNSDAWSVSSCLKLDVYTQTDCSYISDNHGKSLSHVCDIVLDNRSKLEHIEQLLEIFGKKMESFLTGPAQTTDVLKRKNVEGMTEVEHCLPFQEKNGMHGPTTTLPPLLPNKLVGNSVSSHMSATINANKSPVMCISPGLSPGVLLPDTPVSINSPSGWGHHMFPAGPDPTSAASIGSQELQVKRTAKVNSLSDCTSKASVLDSKMESVTKSVDPRTGLESDHLALVPVIIAGGLKNKKSITTEVQLHNIINGTVSTIEDMEHVSYSHGCWLGDKTNPDSRVWYCGDPKLLQRAEASGTNPAKLSLNLLEALFVRDEMAASNINGARGRELLDPIKIKAIQAHINYKFPIELEKEELRWQFLKPRIDSKCRAQRRLQREQQARLETTPQGVVAERPFRSRLRVDPKEKDELLYGYNRTLDLGLSVTSEAQQAVSEFRVTECKTNDMDQLPADEAVVEISGTPVTLEASNV